MCESHRIEPPAPAPKSTLQRYWGEPVKELVTLNEPEISEAQQERHRIYLLMLMALVHHYWNPLKYGREGVYRGREDGHPSWEVEHEYKGHNIAALAIDRNGRVLDFDFNHNKLYNSSAEHAEARLVRRVFALAHLADAFREIETEAPREGAGASPRLSEYDMLSEVTIYTSLESCAQCAGMMALGNVKSVVYLQTDPGMYLVGNMLRNLSGEMPRAPRPIRAEEVGADEWQEALEQKFARYTETAATEPFWTPEDGSQRKPDLGISTFLATPAARGIFERGANRFAALAADPLAGLECVDEPSLDRTGNEVDGSLTSAQAVGEAAHFLEYAMNNGRRGTPHRG